MTSNNFMGWLIAAVVVGTTATSAAADAENAPKVDLAIERKNAGAALVELGESAGIQIAVPSGISRQKQLGPITGSYTVVEALDSLLKDTGLAYHFAGTDSVAIGLDQDEPTAGGAAPEPAPAPEPADDDADDEDVELIVVTGSRLARQPGQMDRQVAVYDRLDIEATGAGTLEEFMRRIPQSFNAPTSNGAAFAGTFGSTSNYFGAAGVNLRGLGERATLVLIDGKRTARGGVLGEATDINQIPLSMIEHIEVIFDGASAIYGADAVGGVVNIITRKDYQGVDARITHNQPAGGGTADTTFSLGATRSWGDANKGSVTVSYQYATRDPLNGDERDLRFATSTTVDEPPYGWPPNLQASPQYDFAAGGFVPVPLFLLDADGNPVPVGDPTGVTEVFRSRMPDDSDGMLTLADFRGLEPVPGSFPEAGLGLIPGRDDHAWSVRVRQELTDTLVVTGSVSLTGGDTYVLESNQNRFLTAEPLMESPWGTRGTPFTPFASQVQLWAEFDFLPDVERFTEKEALIANLALDGRFGEAWEWQVSAYRATSENRGLHLNEMDGGRLYCVGSPFGAQCEEDPRLGTLNIFHLPYFGLSSEEEFVDVLVVPDSRTINESTNTEYEFTVRGPLFEAPGGAARTLLSVSRRSEVTYLFDESGTIEGETLGVFPILGGSGLGPDIAYQNEMSRHTDSVAAEINIPLFGRDNARPGLNGLDLTFSARYDDVRSEGGVIRDEEFACCPRQTTLLSETQLTLEDPVTAWSAGFVWRPTDWLRFRANVNGAYAAPPLVAYVKPTIRTYNTYQFRDQNFRPILDENGNPYTVDRISVHGGNPHLERENNTSRSFGFDVMPEAVPNLVVRVNFHWNELVNRIGNLQPAWRGLDPTAFGPELPHISVDEETGRLIWPNGGYRFNLGKVETNGIDVDVTYFVETDFGDFDARFDYAHITESLWRQVDDCGAGNASCSYEAYGQPVDVVADLPLQELGPDFFTASPFTVTPAHRFDLRVGWAWKGWRVDVSTAHQSETVTRVSRYRRETGERIRGSNTVRAANPVDLSVRYDFEQSEWKPDYLRHTRIFFSMPNIFDDNASFDLQPVFPADAGGVFDPIASRPRGRAFALTVEKKFGVD